jgi:hypothetical protein
LKERYKDNTSTHLNIDPDLWLEEGSSCGLDRNRVHILSNTTTKNLWMTHSVSTVGWSQLVLSTQSPEFAALLDQEVYERITHLNEKYERLSTNYEELCWVVMEMISQIGDICEPPYWPHDPRDGHPPPPPPTPSLF